MCPGASQPVKEDQELPTDLSLGDALTLAIQAHRTGHSADAEILYNRILEVAPQHPDALHFLGVLLHKRGNSDTGIELINKSIAIDPSQPDRYNNLGNVLLEMGRLAEATAAYEKAIALAPSHANAYNNLGAVYKAQERFDEAAAAYQKAIELDPDHADAHNNLGNLRSAQGKVKEAVAHYCKAITLMPSHPETRKLLGIAYYTLGQTDAAAEVYRHWLADEPNNPIAQHLLAACSGQNVPPRASDAYVESTFDRFAESFDAKLGKLAYRAPELVAEALARACATPGKRFVALDAGCGTGLCGPLLAPYVRRLVGVDLSSQMLTKAQGRAVYDELLKVELTAYLGSQSGAFDLIVSADTLVYFGPLEEVLGAARGALQDEGLLIFTVEAVADEAADGSGYRLNPHGRYSHGRDYLQRVLPDAGFAVLAVEPVVLRMEGGKPVAGLVVTGRKHGGHGKRPAAVP